MSDVALALVTQSAVVDDTCNHIGAVVFQISSGGTQVAPGSQRVNRAAALAPMTVTATRERVRGGPRRTARARPARPSTPPVHV